MTLKERQDKIVESYMTAINAMEKAGVLTEESKALILKKMSEDIALATEIDNMLKQYQH